MDKSENVTEFRASNVVRIRRSSLTLTETLELQRLFDQVADTCDAASELLEKAGTPLIGAEMHRLRNLKNRAEAMVECLKSILD